MTKLAIRFIEAYQQHGGGKELFYVDCNFTPSCSEYAKESFRRFGFFRGASLAFRRISRCTQSDLAKPIDDPVPDILHKRGK